MDEYGDFKTEGLLLTGFLYVAGFVVSLGLILYSAFDAQRATLSFNIWSWLGLALLVGSIRLNFWAMLHWVDGWRTFWTFTVFSTVALLVFCFVVKDIAVPETPYTGSQTGSSSYSNMSNLGKGYLRLAVFLNLLGRPVSL